MVSDAFRAMIRDAERARVPTSAPCRLLGEQVGERECKTCKGVRLKVFPCPHHPEGVTLAECQKCLPELRRITASVVLATCNEPDLVETVRSIWDWNGIDEVVIVDDASDNGSLSLFADAAKKFGADPAVSPYTVNVPGFPPVHVVHNETRQGVSRSLNAGARHAAGHVVIVYSGHMRATGQNLHTLATEAIARNAIVQAASIGMDLDTRMRGFGCRWIEHDEKVFDLKWHTGRPADEYAEVDGLMGACYAIPATIYRHLGGFAQHTGLWGFLEGFLSMKCNLAGVPIFVSRDIFARHQYRQASERGFNVPARSVWLSRFAGLKIILEPATFELALPDLKRRYWHPDIGAFLETPGVAQEHRAFQAIRKVSDRDWFQARLPDLWARWTQ